MVRTRLAAVAVLLSLGLAAACVPPSPPPTTVAPGGTAGAVAAAINQDRAAYGLAPVAWNQRLGDVAQHWSAVLAFTGQLTHQDLTSLIESPAFAGWHTMAENLLVAPAGSGARAIENAWMASAEHRAHILDRSNTLVGVGLTYDSQGRVWVVADFGG